MILVIAEKPSLARAIQSALGNSNYTITALRGHVLEQAFADDYLPDTIPKNNKGRKIWRKEDLPIIPSTWIKRPRKDVADVLKDVVAKIKKADRIIHAGDPDREGQLLVDEVLDYAGYKGRVDRVWLTALTPEAIRKSFEQAHSNSNYINLSFAAEARARADWLVGINFTRAWTIANHRLISIGRVQTPTLNLVVQRDLAIENFKPKPFFVVRLHIKHPKGGFWATWEPKEDAQGLDEEGRIIDRALAERMAALRGEGIIIESSRTPKERFAPLPLDLGALQKEAGAQFKLSAQQTLDIAQKLYEEGYTSYPRTDCRYLNDVQYDEVFQAVDALAPIFGNIAPSRAYKHAAFNTKKVGAHTAIVPTGKPPQGLSGRDLDVFHLIAKTTLALFMPPEKYLAVRAVWEKDGERFIAQSKQVLDPGWTVLVRDEDDIDQPSSTTAIPEMNVGDTAQAIDGQMDERMTQPPARFTDGTLIQAMSAVHRFVDDAKIKAILKETSGIGTSATRANIIETLVSRGFLKREKGKLISTAEGRALIDTVEPALKDPGTTALWEDALTAISEGKQSMESFEEDIIRFVKENIHRVQTITRANNVEMPCPVEGCGGTVRRLESKKKKGVYFWACSNKDKHPLLRDENGKPGAPFGEHTEKADAPPRSKGPLCPKCKKPTLVYTTKSGKTYFRCNGCQTAWWPDWNDSTKLGKKWQKM